MHLMSVSSIAFSSRFVSPFFFFNDTATTEIYTLSLHDALPILAPSGSEVYVDDERYGSVGRSGRVILSSIAPGKHVLRVSKSGEPDDERVIEIRSDKIGRAHV